ncbi:rhomboid-like protein [Streptomyces sp. NPDC057301]|uniref:rhomboid-like protein n=1 Tax=Streptomyces sp. NPDC057301 TaxID=3346093 RepID=UPI003643FD5E
MERTAAGGVPGSAPVPGEAGLPEVAELLDGMPRQRGPLGATAPSAATAPPSAPGAVTTQPSAPLPSLGTPWRLLPTPVGTPFTFAYAAVLAVTSLVATYADPDLVHALHQGSSTDVAHLVGTPLTVLLASALWVAGGFVAPYTLSFLLVLTALERRIGGMRTAVVFLTGHVLATLATEVPVGLAVLAGHLPGSSLHRLDYGISFGVATGVGALSGLLRPWLRWPVLVLFGGMLLQGLVELTDPLTNWGHLTALVIGIAMWPVVRGWYVGEPADTAGRGAGGAGRGRRAVDTPAPPLGQG